MYAKAKYSKLVMSKYAILDETNQNQASEQREFHWKKKKEKFFVNLKSVVVWALKILVKFNETMSSKQV